MWVDKCETVEERWKSCCKLRLLILSHPGLNNNIKKLRLGCYCLLSFSMVATFCSPLDISIKSII